MTIKNTAQLRLNNGARLSRRFLGNLFPKTCFEHKELQAYVKGQENFSYGRNELGKQLWYKVRQEYYYK